MTGRARVRAGLAGAALVAALLAGCAASDTVGSAVGSKSEELLSAATCAVLTPVLAGVTDAVDDAVAQIEVDPAQARIQLERARVTLVEASTGASAVGAVLAPLTGALDVLIDLASKAEAGVAIDDAERTGAAAAVEAALAGLTADCG